MKLGPKGSGIRGKCWDDWDYCKINAIYIWHGESINGIKPEYRGYSHDRLLSDWYGGDGGDGGKLDVIELQEREDIVCVSGHSSYGRICSLTFITKDNISGKLIKYGAFGKEEGEPFYYEIPSGKFRGFHGHADDKCIQSIGVYVEASPTKVVGTILPPQTTLPLKSMLTKSYYDYDFQRF